VDESRKHILTSETSNETEAYMDDNINP